MAEIVPMREFRARLATLFDAVAKRREHVVVTRRGRPAAVLIPVDEYDALEETAEILSDAALVDDIEAARHSPRSGDLPLERVLADLRSRRPRAS